MPHQANSGNDGGPWAQSLQPPWLGLNSTPCFTTHGTPLQVQRQVLSGQGRSRCTAWVHRGPQQMCGAYSPSTQISSAASLSLPETQ
jgi:hypothetical protein